MASLTAVELGADTCAFARTSVRGGDVHLHAAEVLEPAAFPGIEAFTTAVRRTRRSMRLPRRCRAIVWGLPDGANRKDAAVKPLLEPLTSAGFRVERVVSPCNALAALARLKSSRLDGSTCWIAINRGGVALVVVRPGKLLYAHSFAWDSTIGASGSQARLLQRYSLVAFLSPEIKRAMAEARKSGTPVDAVVTCGNLPELRSLTMPLIEELDVEVETLDSLEGLTVKPAVVERLGESAASIRLACAAAIARGTRPWDPSRKRSGANAVMRYAQAALFAGAALGLGYWYLKMRMPPAPAPVAKVAVARPQPKPAAPAVNAPATATKSAAPVVSAPAAALKPTPPAVSVPAKKAESNPPPVSKPANAATSTTSALRAPVAAPSPAAPAARAPVNGAARSNASAPAPSALDSRASAQPPAIPGSAGPVAFKPAAERAPGRAVSATPPALKPIPTSSAPAPRVPPPAVNASATPPATAPARQAVEKPVQAPASIPRTAIQPLTALPRPNVAAPAVARAAAPAVPNARPANPDPGPRVQAPLPPTPAPRGSVLNTPAVSTDKPGADPTGRAGVSGNTAAARGPLPALLKDAVPRVTAILVSRDRRFATVDGGQIVGIGDVLGRRTVVAMDERSVLLQEPSGVQIRIGLGGRLLAVERANR
jgi:hypothetical protein